MDMLYESKMIDISETPESLEDINYIPKKIAIFPCNSLVGSSLVDCLRNDHMSKHPHKIFGLVDLNEDSTKCPDGVDVIITDKSFKSLFVFLAECDIIFLEFIKLDFQFLEFLYGKLKEFQCGEEKKLIILSSPLLWSESNVALLNQDREKEECDYVDQSEYFDETYFVKRKCLPRFELIRLLENEFVELDFYNLNLQPILITPGFIYGRGEDDLYPLFEKGFLRKNNFVIFGKGNNLVPLCHVSDLVACIKVILNRVLHWKKMEIINFIFVLIQSKQLKKN
jgi:hypothetical protein